jgi:hypothetical protein
VTRRGAAGGGAGGPPGAGAASPLPRRHWKRWRSLQSPWLPVKYTVSVASSTHDVPHPSTTYSPAVTARTTCPDGSYRYRCMNPDRSEPHRKRPFPPESGTSMLCRLTHTSLVSSRRVVAAPVAVSKLTRLTLDWARFWTVPKSRGFPPGFTGGIQLTRARYLREEGGGVS